MSTAILFGKVFHIYILQLELIITRQIDLIVASDDGQDNMVWKVHALSTQHAL
jgi:hypothetical protein